MSSEMHDLIQQKNWSATPLGPREKWPPILTTLVDVMLNSRFPMFLFWGTELISLYNDAFKPSLGINGKHPAILGAPAKIAWAEIWDIISPLLEQALRGEPVWHQDLLVPFYRNGRIEDIYWTFSYSKIPDENGKACGVLVICTETTEKVLYTKNLQESQNRFRNVVHQAPIGITIFRGEDMIVEMASDAYLQIVGKAENELLGKPFFDVLPELRGHVSDLLLNVLKTGDPYYGTEFKVSFNRYGVTEDRYFNFVYFPLRENDGLISGIIVVASEVTEQVNAKFRLQESERKFRELVMNSPIPMTIFKGENFVIELANDVMLRNIWRKKEADVIGRKLLEAFPELKDQKYPELLRKVRESKVAHNEKESIAYVQGDDGLKRFIVDYEYTPLVDSSNEVWGIMVTVNDITEKAEARRRIEENEQKLNIVIEASDLGTWEVDFKTGKIGYSHRYLEILGYKEPVVLTHEMILKHLHPDDREMRETAYKAAFETGTLHYSSRLIWNDGTIHWMEGRGKVFYDTEGKPERMLGTVRDITEEKRQQEVQKSFAEELERKVAERTRELAQKNIDLENMNAELKSFAYVSSHDLQEPLRKIQTFASRIKEIEPLSEKGQDYFFRIQRSANQMQILIQDLLAYSRTNKIEQVFEHVNLNDVVEEVKHDFQEMLIERNGEIQIENLGAVRIIPVQFRQVMHNLISNSLKFSRPDVPPRIRIVVEPKIDPVDIQRMFSIEGREYCKVSVIDNGIGFDPVYKDRIFEVFQRLHGKHEYSGTGVGLAIVKKIIENHNGFIEATAEPGKGARFDIYLPLN